MAETEEELTPLKKKLDDFGTFLSKVPPDIGMLVFLSHAQKFCSSALEPKVVDGQSMMVSCVRRRIFDEAE